MSEASRGRDRTVSGGIHLRTISEDGWGRPYALACPTGDCGSGTFFVSDERLGVVRTIEANGSSGSIVADKLRSPQGIATANGQLFIAEAAAGRVLKVDIERGAPESIWQGVIQPSALAVYDNTLYLASAGQHAIFAKDLRSPDNVSVVVGQPGVAGNMKYSNCGDGGLAVSAQLFSPFGLAVNDAGDLYVADSFNGRVRAVRGGVITTVAGAAQEMPRGNRGVATSINIGQPRGLVSTPMGIFVSTTPGLVWYLRGEEAVPAAGTWVDGYNGDDGEATEVRLNVPCGLGWWRSSLLIADSDNRRICAVEYP